MMLPPPGEDVSLPAPAQATAFTLDDLIALALGENPTLGGAAAQVQAARGEWLQSGLYPNPVVGYTGYQIGDQGRAGQQGAYFEQEFVLGGKLRLNRAAASQEVRRSRQLLEAQRLRIITDVRVAYYDVVYAERTVAIAEQLVRIGDEGARATDALLRAQEVSRADLLQARVEAGAARIILSNSQHAYAAAWRRLAAVVGVPDRAAPPPIVAETNDEPPALDWSGTAARLEMLSPEMAAAQAEVARTRWALERARVEPIPNPDVQYYPQHDFGTGDGIQSIQATFAVPLFNANQGNIRRAEADVAAALRNLERVRLDLRSRLADAFQRYDNARRQAEQYTREMVPASKEALDLISIGYRQGEYSYLSYLTAQRTYYQVSLASLDAQRELRQSLAVIDGMLLSGSLARQ